MACSYSVSVTGRQVAHHVSGNSQERACVSDLHETESRLVLSLGIN